MAVEAMERRWVLGVHYPIAKFRLLVKYLPRPGLICGQMAVEAIESRCVVNAPNPSIIRHTTRQTAGCGCGAASILGDPVLDPHT